MKSVIKSAKTIEEAINLGLKDLNIDREDAEFEILQEPSKGILGIFGGADAVVKVKVKETKENIGEILVNSILNEDIIKNELKIEEEKEDLEDDSSEDDFDLDKEELFVEEEVYLEDINEDEEDFELYSEIKEELSEDDEKLDENEEFEYSKLDKQSSKENLAENIVYTSGENSLNTSELVFSGEAKVITDGDTLKDIADKAKSILEDLLIKMHINAKVSYETARDNIVNLKLSDITENDTGIVIGARGETLNALQYILSLIVNKNINKYYRITLNVGDYVDRRKKSIESNARRVAYKVLKTKKSIALKPMNSYERRIVHFALQNYKELETVSSGKFPNRKVVIKYKGL